VVGFADWVVKVGCEKHTGTSEKEQRACKENELRWRKVIAGSWRVVNVKSVFGGDSLDVMTCTRAKSN
jgi:hypothetical protein